MLEVKWRRERRRILLPIAALAPSPASDLSSVAATALFDTGSSTSGITRNIADRLGLQPLGKRPLSSAQGLGYAERFLFRVGIHPSGADETASFPFVFEEVMGFELTNAFEFDALLGMDIIGRCDFTMDREGICLLRFG